MEKEFIPYEEALALKELGFDGEVLGYYIDANVHGTKHKLVTKVIEDNTYFYNNLKAPLYQQAFDWFRSEHKMVYLPNIGTHEYSFNIWDEAKDCMTLHRLATLSQNSRHVCMMLLPKEEFNGSYEEGRLAGLQKLIELATGKTCDYCETVGVDVSLTIDPYNEELHGDTTEYLMCNSCVQERKNDI